MSTKHTPGPWVTEKHDGDEWWFGGRDGMEIVVRTAADKYGTVCVLGALPQETPADANARLIAAAPDLLAAAMCAQNVLFLLKDEVKALGCHAGNVQEMLRAAIERASS